MILKSANCCKFAQCTTIKPKTNSSKPNQKKNSFQLNVIETKQMHNDFGGFPYAHSYVYINFPCFGHDEGDVARLTFATRFQFSLGRHHHILVACGCQPTAKVNECIICLVCSQGPRGLCDSSWCFQRCAVFY